ncbi:MAG: histidinol-phosphate transaminase [Flavobacterium psychrophilum]|nr:MAG: histidinol-phosphate transaminase [Flavobacterium psychrophilum]
MFKLNTIVRPNILELQPYSSARDEFTGYDGIFLDANENPFGNLNRYPDPLQKELKEKIANVKSISTQNIFVGNGSDEAIDMCFRIFCKLGIDKVITFNPTYGMYEVCSTINNIEMINIPLTTDFQIDIEKTLTTITDKAIKLLFVCSPNNPTGNCIEGIKTILENFKGIVVIDEAYADFTDSSWIEKLNQYPNLIVLQTLSKAWGLAAARVGLAFASAEIIALFNKVKPPYNISRLNYEAAISKLDDIDSYEKQKALIIAERQNLAKVLDSIPYVTKVYPSEANFILIKVSNADIIYDALVKQNIIIRNRNKAIHNCLRISIGTPIENKKLIIALQNITL